MWPSGGKGEGDPDHNRSMSIFNLSINICILHIRTSTNPHFTIGKLDDYWKHLCVELCAPWKTHTYLLIYWVAHKNVDCFILLPTTCIYIHAENFFNISTVPKTLIKMLCNISALGWNSWSQSFPRLSSCLLGEIRQTASRFQDCPVACSVKSVRLPVVSKTVQLPAWWWNPSDVNVINDAADNI